MIKLKFGEQCCYADVSNHGNMIAQVYRTARTFPIGEEIQMKMVYSVENWKSLIVNLPGGTKKCYTLENTQTPFRYPIPVKTILIWSGKCPWSG